MIIIAGTLTVDPDKVDDLLAAAVPLMEATNAEPGNLAYVFTKSVVDPGTVHVFEKWESEEALGGHFQAPHMAAFQASIGDFGVSGMDLLKYEIASEGPLF